jgi:hypothetical protein
MKVLLVGTSIQDWNIGGREKENLEPQLLSTHGWQGRQREKC